MKPRSIAKFPRLLVPLDGKQGASVCSKRETFAIRRTTKCAPSLCRGPLSRRLRDIQSKTCRTIGACRPGTLAQATFAVRSQKADRDNQRAWWMVFSGCIAQTRETGGGACCVCSSRTKKHHRGRHGSWAVLPLHSHRELRKARTNM